MKQRMPARIIFNKKALKSIFISYGPIIGKCIMNLAGSNVLLKYSKVSRFRFKSMYNTRRPQFFDKQGKNTNVSPNINNYARLDAKDSELKDALQQLAAAERELELWRKGRLKPEDDE